MKKNILVVCGHPAQYHFFKNSLRILQSRGHKIKLLIKTKDVLENLVEADGWDYENIQKSYRKNNKFSILAAAFQRTFAVFKIARIFRADILLSSGESTAQAGFLLRKPAITTLEDDAYAIKNLVLMTYPFTTHIVVPTPCDVGKWKSKKIGYNGFMKLAYLHPRYFTPDKNVLHDYGISNRFILVRLARLVAYHDDGITGINTEVLDGIIEIASSKGYDIYISSEDNIDEKYQPYILKINPTHIHHILAFSRLLISDSQSMSVEAAMLGVPSLRYRRLNHKIGVLEELEKEYCLTFGIDASEYDKLLVYTEKILCNPEIAEVFKERHNRLLKDKIDVTAFLVWFIEEYPKSIEEIKRDDNWQNQFKNQ